MQDSNSSSKDNPMINFSAVFMKKVMLVQILVGVFLYVNCLMIFTFLKKEAFREDTRYILFAQTLLVDSVLLVVSDAMLISNNYMYLVHIIPCIILCTFVTLLNICTPLTLVAMCLERYVAICMPLRHSDISTSRMRFFGLLIIWGISSIVPLVTLIAYLSVVPHHAFFSYTVCSVEFMYEKEWQAQARVTLLQVLFLLMIIIIVFTYIKIMIAARAASSDNKKSTNKSLRTVILHAFQLFLCIMQFLSPYIEIVFLKIDVMVYAHLRYVDFVIFIIAPRCLSPLIYGLRDEKFFQVLKQHALLGLDRLISTLFKHEKCKIGPVQVKTL